MNSSKANTIPSKTMASTAEETGSVEKHDFGYHFMVNKGSCSWHQHVCEKCGLAQKYGRRYGGSNKYPGYEKVDPKCPGKWQTCI
eukprot:CAMPEP_0198146880 /NCGR_PEP_ID=MMETSP1443-20131203/32046_1 /TAXON_ID=186043 /ORGANISM="Entomoneis sp., Strain CCMP2396" /LENGTH=84 /DNA_ID=CAMNT_0043810983 /DNA_START=15 /DNA_END=269 /DNA_ORIENTATION=+